MRGLALVLAVLFHTTVGAQMDEYGVKAAFVRNFLTFVDWPMDRLPRSMPLVVCVFNDSPLTSKLAALAVEVVRDHPVHVRTAGALPDLDGCHVTFVPASEASQLTDVLRRYRDKGMLTITESERPHRTGAVINLFVSSTRIAFEIDLAAARAARLQVSSKLLALARPVHGETAPTPLASRASGEEREH